ncbi:uncharacterized protein LOC117038426 [Rhinolophus ferrumequinum]|uniref:uncharacterized protein LOC117038426 n=1 Tax=Rhinolophus ferrumequinum TaxID=59479 RepID=UPI00140FD3BB|nr:uncharacterized protein LOC117038426 [Rhinolophus ferrumequinum]
MLLITVIISSYQVERPPAPSRRLPLPRRREQLGPGPGGRSLDAASSAAPHPSLIHLYHFGVGEKGRTGALAPELDSSPVPKACPACGPLRVFRRTFIHPCARGLQQASSGRLTPQIPAADLCSSSCGTPDQAAPGLGQLGKSLDPKGWGRTKSLWKTSLLSHCLCDWGSCGRVDAVVLFSLHSPTPIPLPAVTAHAFAPLFTYFFSLFSHSIFSPPPSFLPLLSFLLASLRRKASLSVFTADLDLNVHTIKARGECQEWGWLSTVGPRGPAKEGATEARRPPRSSALRVGEGGVSGSCCLGCGS